MSSSMLLLSVLSSLSGTTTGTTSAPDAWSSLDREIDSLSLALAQEQPNGPQFSGWIRTRYANSNDVDVDSVAAGGQDLGGFSLDSVRVNINGTVGEGYSYWISFEAGNQALLDAGSTGGVALYDAYATVSLGKYAQVIVGRFASNFLWSTNIEERKLVFLDRTFVGENTDNKDLGLEFSGALDRFNWWVAVQNGSDAAADEVALSGRASVRLIGEPMVLQEGCCEPTGDDTQLILGAGYFDDSNLDDGTAVGADVWFSQRPFSAYVEVVNWGDDIQPLAAIDPISGVAIPSGTGAAGAETSTSLTVAYMVVPEEWEVAARWQGLDDDADTTVLSAAVNRYFAGHDAKWTLQFDTSDSDDDALEADTLALGLTVGF